MLPCERSVSRLDLWILLVAPLLITVAYFVFLFANPQGFEAWLWSEQGLVELLSAASWFAASAIAVRICVRNRKVIPRIYVVAYALLACATLIMGLEELSYGQHFFGWNSPDFFERYNRNRETNLHNMGNLHNVNDYITIASPVVYTFFGIGLPVSIAYLRGRYKAGSLAYYLLPGIELVSLISLGWALNQIPRLFPEQVAAVAVAIPSDPFFKFGNAKVELREFYYALAFLVYAVVMARRFGTARRWAGKEVDVEVPWPGGVVGLILLLGVLGLGAGRYMVLLAVCLVPVFWLLRKPASRSL